MLTRFLVHVLALLFVFYVIWQVHQRFLIAAIVMALILALVNTIIRPVLLILTFPVTIITHRLFVLVLNALLFAPLHAVVMAGAILVVLGRIDAGLAAASALAAVSMTAASLCLGRAIRRTVDLHISQILMAVAITPRRYRSARVNLI